ncbi:MAG TPA: DUF92 domain-containing protein [Thermoanaerobaculia bacterium]|nr:DUF92 domain-containing protein [Thermoanaerobaculia bacterium]
MPHQPNEILRKSLHIAFGVFAFALAWIDWRIAAGVAASAVIANWLVLHRIVGKAVSRHERGFDAGIVLYPFMVMLLIVVFRDRIHFAGIAWALMAFGDGFATLAAKMMRIAPLPWNRDKSWGGFLGFLIAGGGMALAVGAWLGWFHPIAIVIAALAAAIAESLAINVDDNITVPFAAATALVIADLNPQFTLTGATTWLAINAALAIAGYLAKSVDVSGAIGGFVLGAIIIIGAGWPLYVTLLAFFVIGTACTKLGYARKARAGLAQEKGGRRGFSHAFSNVGVAAICALAVPRAGVVPYLMAVASLATATADTTASEIGQFLGRRAFLPLSLRRVPVGTEGAISIEGTLAGLIGGLVAAVAGVVSFGYGVPRAKAIVLVTLCAFAGSYLESIAGSWNRKRIAPVPNGALNFFNTAAGALLAYLAWQITN